MRILEHLAYTAPPVTCFAMFVWVHRALKRFETILNTMSRSYTLYPALSSSKAIETSNHDGDEDFLQIKKYGSYTNIFEDDLCAGDWCYDKTLVVLSEDMTMNCAMERMHECHANCALLYTHDGSLHGILDTRDIVQFVLRSDSSMMTSSPRNAVRQCIIAPKTVSVNEICTHLCSGMHYIAVCSSNGGHQIVSQRAMVATIVRAASNNQCLTNALMSNLAKHYIGKNIVSCKVEDNARQAFEKMAAYGITSLPIIDSENNAHGIISATDIMQTRKGFAPLSDNVMAYVAKSRADANISRKANCIVSCLPNDNLMTILRLMLHEEVHHVYVLKKNVPIGIVSFASILNQLMTHALRDEFIHSIARRDTACEI